MAAEVIGVDEHGEEQFIPTVALCVDHSYQRQPSTLRVKKIAQHYDANLTGRIIVSRRADNTYYIVDGQHRVAAMQQRKLSHAPCIVFSGWSVEREAEMFRRLNTEFKRPSHYELHHSGVTANHEDALAIERIVTEAGCTLSERHPKGGTRARVCAVETCYRIYHSRYGGPELLQRTITILAECFGDQAHALDGELIVGLAYFLWRADKEEAFSESELRKRLMEVTPQYILTQAKSHASILRDRVCGALVYILRDLYNKGRRSKKLSEWPRVNSNPYF